MCACGCGERTSWSAPGSKRRWNQYAHGHAGKVTIQKAIEARRGQEVSQETRNKMSVNAKKRMKNGTFPRPPFRNTKIERAVQQRLSERGLIFASNAWKFGYNWDIVLDAQKTFVEVDGCYWHGCQVCGYPFRPDKAARDQARDQKALRMGWRVVRILEHEIKAGDFSALDEVKV